ncbi:MAG: hypothetical protein ACREIA_01155 [Opitutaceae bacterium]
MFKSTLLCAFLAVGSGPQVLASEASRGAIVAIVGPIEITSSEVELPASVAEAAGADIHQAGDGPGRDRRNQIQANILKSKIFNAVIKLEGDRMNVTISDGMVSEELSKTIEGLRTANSSTREIVSTYDALVKALEALRAGDASRDALYEGLRSFGISKKTWEWHIQRYGSKEGIIELKSLVPKSDDDIRNQTRPAVRLKLFRSVVLAEMKKRSPSAVDDSSLLVQAVGRYGLRVLREELLQYLPEDLQSAAARQ